MSFLVIVGVGVVIVLIKQQTEQTQTSPPNYQVKRIETCLRAGLVLICPLELEARGSRLEARRGEKVGVKKNDTTSTNKAELSNKNHFSCCR